jgi:probable DNA metabolism protein
MIYFYDSTFFGLLTVFSKVFTEGKEPEDILRLEGPQADLFSRFQLVQTDPEKAARFLAAVERRLSRESVRNVFHAFLSEKPGIEIALWRYLALGRRVGWRLDADLAHPDVLAVHRPAQRFRGEAHRMKGLLRFREMGGGLLYAPMSPDGNVLPLISPYFAACLPRERFLIHDERRRLGAFCDGGRWEVGEVELESIPEPSPDEEVVGRLWRRFFSELAIPVRRNKRLQKGRMPMKYWKYLTEMEGQE